MRIVALALLLPLATACPQSAEQTTGQPTAVVLPDLRPGTPLEQMLLHLDQELVRAIAGGMDGPATEHFLRAEAISDRLLEARQPFEWIATDQYSVQARLRQIQSGADRVMAQYETRAPRDSMLHDLRILRADVLRLRQAISRGGGRAPVPLDQLLAADSARPRPRPEGGATAPAPPRDTTRITTTSGE